MKKSPALLYVRSEPRRTPYGRSSHVLGSPSRSDRPGLSCPVLLPQVRATSATVSSSVPSTKWMRHASSSKPLTQAIGSLQVTLPGVLIHSIHSIEIDMFDLFDPRIAQSEVIDYCSHRFFKASLLVVAFTKEGRVDDQSFFVVE